MTESKRYLNLCEVLLILSDRLHMTSVSPNQTIRTCYDYCSKFAAIQNRNTVQLIYQVFESLDNKVSDSQFSQIMDLLPATTDEAKILIPSLSRIPDETVNNIIRDIEVFRMQVH